MEIYFGLLSPTITQQLKQQNLSFENSKNYDKCIDCMNTLWREHFLINKEREKVFKRIFKQIEREVKLC